MTAPENSYVVAPDGLPARDVGGWVGRKVHFVDRYVHIFATGMKNKWPRRAYVELFSGPGMSWDRDHRKFVVGSAMRALEAEFTDFCYVDLDKVAAEALWARIKDRPVAHEPTVMIGDCNDATEWITTRLPKYALTLAFVDPTNWQVRMDAIGRLVSTRRVDLIVTFQYGAMQRVAHLPLKAVDDFFGTNEWRAILDGPKGGRLLSLIDLYNRQLVPYGYLEGASEHTVVVKNTKNRVLYALVLFTKSQRGYDFWKKAIQEDESGQRSLWEEGFGVGGELVVDPTVELPAAGLGGASAPLLEEEGDL